MAWLSGELKGQSFKLPYDFLAGSLWASLRQKPSNNINVLNISEMKFLSKRMDLFTVIAIVLMAISISIFDFSNLSWNNNIKSYVGLLIFVLLIVFSYLNNRDSKSK